MIPALEVRDLTRRFGNFTAVERLSFSVQRGEICGFIGPNGAGKTTTMRICSTLDLPDHGDVFISGESVLEQPRRVRRKLGFMPDAYGAYSNTTVADYLDFFARSYGLRGEEKSRTIARLVEFTSLGHMLEKLTTALSKGMKQRLCLAKTMLNDPDLLILDEPAAGLDPRARIELRELVKALAGMDKAILISSHILSELGETCDSVVVIEEGRLKAAGNVSQMTEGIQRERSRVLLRALVDPQALLRAVLEEPHVEGARVERGGVVLDLPGGAEGLARLVEALVKRGVRLTEFRQEKLDLEEVFLSMTDGRVQ